MDVVMYDGVVQLHDSSLFLDCKGCCGDLLWRVWLAGRRWRVSELPPSPTHKLVPARDIRTGLGQNRA